MYWYCRVPIRLQKNLCFLSLLLCLHIFALGKLMFINIIQYMSAKFTTEGRREFVLGIMFNCFRIPTEKQLIVRLLKSRI